MKTEFGSIALISFSIDLITEGGILLILALINSTANGRPFPNILTSISSRPEDENRESEKKTTQINYY